MKRLTLILSITALFLTSVVGLYAEGTMSISDKVGKTIASMKARAIQSQDRDAVRLAELLTKPGTLEKLFELNSDTKASFLGFGSSPTKKCKKAVKKAIDEECEGMARVISMKVIEKDDYYLVKSNLIILIYPSLWEHHVDKESFEVIESIEIETFND